MARTPAGKDTATPATDGLRPRSVPDTGGGGPHPDGVAPHEPASADARAAAVARWLHLTRVVLPGMAAAQRWPIRRDHCFMRVCLDVAIGAPWYQRVARPAIRHLDDSQLARAIDLARSIAADPASLPGLNRQSLALRGKDRG